MKRLRLLLVLPLLGLAQNSPDQKPSQAMVSGVVVTETGAALSGASVTLMPDTRLAGTPGMVAGIEPKTTRTGEKGTFSLDGVKPGTYLLAAESRGYPPQGYGAPTGVVFGAPILVQSGRELTGLRIVLTSQGIISGRVRDANGDPVQGVMVHAVRWSYTSNLYPSVYNGVRKLEQAGIEDRTTVQGAFRIAGLSPGRYFVYAEPSRTREDLKSEHPGMALPTFAPNALDVSRAAAVEVFAGGEIPADIRLRQDGTFTVRGKVTGPGGPAAGAVVVMLDHRDTPLLGRAGADTAVRRARSSRTPFAAQTRTDSEGNFVMRGVPPGSHRLFVSGGKNLNFGPRFTSIGSDEITVEGGSALVEVTVRDQDVDDVTARLIPGAKASVNFRFEQGPERGGKTPSIARWTLVPEQGVSLGGYPDFGQPQELSPGRYYLDFPMPIGYYVKSVRLTGQDIANKQLIISGGAADLDVLLAPSASHLTGSIADREGHPVAGATVSVWPVNPNPVKQNGGALALTSAHDGSFTHRLEPGEYYVAAFEGLPDPGLGQYPGFYSQFASRAERVKVAVDGAATANVKVIPKSDVDRAIGALP